MESVLYAKRLFMAVTTAASRRNTREGSWALAANSHSEGADKPVRIEIEMRAYNTTISFRVVSRPFILHPAINALGTPPLHRRVAGGWQPLALLGAGARPLLTTLRLVTLGVTLVAAAAVALPAARGASS